MGLGGVRNYGKCISDGGSDSDTGFGRKKSSEQAQRRNWPAYKETAGRPYHQFQKPLKSSIEIH